jgi:hypothetical protein
MDLTTVLRRLYASEINAGLSSFWDGGWDVWIGGVRSDPCERVMFDDDQFDQIAPWLDEAARRHFPQSLYAAPQKNAKR